MVHKARFTLIAVMAVLLIALGMGGVVPAQTSSGAVPAAAPLAGPLPVSSVTAGLDHTCVLINGAVKCWGSNRYGQLGNNALGSNSLTIRPFPVSVTNLTGTVIQISAGANHTCALVGGAVYCWGLNSLGQLGNNSTANSVAPVPVSGLSGIQQIASGYGFTCALTATNTVMCWGDNSVGQLGNGGTTSSPVPVAVGGGLANVTAIAGGFDHACALISGGASVMCWGRNVYGELGNGTLVNSSTPVPVTLPGGTVVTGITAGSQHSCALTSAHTVLCWGDGSLGQMGNGTNTQKNPAPVPVSSLTTATSIAANGYSDTGHTCAVTSTGALMCWGSNALGQIGDGTNTNRNVPTAVSALGTAVHAAAVGVNHSCALMNDTTVQCWGSDSSGQLGDGVNSVSTQPVNVSGVSGGTAMLGTSEQGTCALINGSVKCWGNNRNGQIGDGTLTNRPAPTAVSGLTGTVTAIDGGNTQTCVILNGGVRCWGSAFSAPTTVIPSGVTSLSVTNLHGCAVVSGAAKCWGDNSKGQLGNNSIVNSATPVQVSNLGSGVKSIATGQWFSCALLTSGAVDCWGDNTNGQLGNNTSGTTPSLVPVPVNGLANVTALTAGQDHACALNSAGAVLCWGNNQQGQLGDGSQTQRLVPTQVSGLTGGVTAITAGGFHTCALVNSGVMCWGFNSFGQLGNGLTTLSKIPVSVSGMSAGVTAVVAGGVNYDEEHTCAITALGTLKCWGGNKYGQLGDNLPILRNSPVRVVGLVTGPDIGVNYTTGQPGSYFRIVVANYAPGVPVVITANGVKMGMLVTSPDGYAIFHILANTSLTSTLPVQVTDGTTPVTMNLNLAASNPLRIQEGSSVVYFVSSTFLYLPYMSR